MVSYKERGFPGDGLTSLNAARWFKFGDSVSLYITPAYSTLRRESVAGHVGKGPEKLLSIRWLQENKENMHESQPRNHAHY